MADGSYFIFGGRDAPDTPIPLPRLGNSVLLCAQCGCDRFTFATPPQEVTADDQ